LLKPGNRITLILILCLFPFSLFADEDPRVQNLRGISAFCLTVETLTPDARQVGINEEVVKSQVAAHFKAYLAHIPLVEKDAPSLYIRIVLHKRKGEDLHYGLISLNVDRPVVILSPGGNFPSLSQVWEKTVVFSGRDPLLGTFEILSKLLTLLIEDFKKANP